MLIKENVLQILANVNISSGRSLSNSPSRTHTSAKHDLNQTVSTITFKEPIKYPNTTHKVTRLSALSPTNTWKQPSYTENMKRKKEYIENTLINTIKSSSRSIYYKQPFSAKKI